MPRRRGSRSLRFVRRVLLLLVAGWFAGLLAIVVWAMRNDSGTADAIVVLGAAQYAGRPSPVLRARLDHALLLFQSRRAPHVVLTGGRREGDQISEAAAGRRYLVRRGVAGSAIQLEVLGRTSLASMRAAAALLHANDSMPTRPRVILVSDPFHMLRLDVLARLHGLSPLSSPTRTSPISANRSVAAEYIVRESFALPTDIAAVMWQRLSPPD